MTPLEAAHDWLIKHADHLAGRGPAPEPIDKYAARDMAAAIIKAGEEPWDWETSMTTMNEEDEAAAALEETGNFRVLRRLPPWTDKATDGVSLKVGAFVDVETTGLDHKTDEVIELGIVLFTYDKAGVIHTVGDAYQSFNQPGKPIPPNITELTGITDAMVAGKKIDAAEIDELIGVANFVIAHHAAFDRKFIEKVCPIAATKPWGCSMEQIPWKAEGWNGRALEYLLMRAGYFYEAHRAEDDCFAGIRLLSTTLPRSGKSAMAALREAAAKPIIRLTAEGSPFEVKDTLKARGYDWNPDSKAWTIDLPDAEKVIAEGEFLATLYRPRDFYPTKTINFYDRFSVRE